jgi:polar amino acid transport system permease protein
VFRIDLLGEYQPLYARAAWLTLWVGAAGILGASAVGLVSAVVSYWRLPLARRVVSGYVELSRNTPLVVQLFFLYFGLPKVGIVLDSATCAVNGLSFLGGSYMAEALRSGIEACGVHQSQAARALGLSRAQTMSYVLLPQALATAMPAISANVIFLLKETSVVSVVALADLVFVAKDLIGTDYNTTEALGLLVVAYLVILTPVSFGLSRLERRVRHGAARA